MQQPKHPPSQELIDNAEHLLAKIFGGKVRLDKGEDLQGGSRTHVYRFKILAGPSHAPASVIVKQVKSTQRARYELDKATMPVWAFFNEWASLQFLAELAELSHGAAFGPRFYGADRVKGLLVMEDLGQGMRLDHILMGIDATAAAEALNEFAAIHGRLHAATIGRQDEYQRLRSSLGPSNLADEHYSYEWLAPTFYQTADLLGITPEPGVEDELAALKTTLLHPGPFLAFIQEDSCLDNCLFVDSQLRLLDFEGGRFDHALKGGVYGKMLFPTCWYAYRIPEHIALHMQTTYRTELSRGCPAASDNTLYSSAVAEACVYWMIQWYQMVPLPIVLNKDRHIAAATDRQRYLQRSAIVAQTTEAVGHMEALGATIRAMTSKMRALWPDVEEMLLYPAFR